VWRSQKFRWSARRRLHSLIVGPIRIHGLDPSSRTPPPSANPNPSGDILSALHWVEKEPWTAPFQRRDQLTNVTGIAKLKECFHHLFSNPVRLGFTIPANLITTGQDSRLCLRTRLPAASDAKGKRKHTIFEDFEVPRLLSCKPTSGLGFGRSDHLHSDRLSRCHDWVHSGLLGQKMEFTVQLEDIRSGCKKAPSFRGAEGGHEGIKSALFTNLPAGGESDAQKGCVQEYRKPVPTPDP
jgi:hypothetical protein